MRKEESYLITKKSAKASDKCPGQILCQNEVWIMDNMPYDSDLEKVKKAAGNWIQAHDRKDWAVIGIRCGKDKKWRVTLSIEEKYFNENECRTDFDHPYASIYAKINDWRKPL